MMTQLVAVLALIAGQTEQPSYLFKMESSPNGAIELRAERYRPQPGDIVLFNDHCPITAKVYQLAGTDGPVHAAIVVARPDGTLAILEARTNPMLKSHVYDFETRLHEFDGTILVRRLRTPLTDEQKKALADFAMAQDGKWYAYGRLALQATPFRPRNTPFAQLFGGTVLDRESWICSELVVAAAAKAGVWPADTFQANVMYPRDLCYDERYDLSQYYDAPALWSPRAQPEHVGKGVRVGRD
jgi:hypothetical protein